MLKASDNELLMQVGPGTPTGNFMREYWIPAALSSEFPAPDCAPVRILLLGEQLIGFRDSNGKIGLIQNNCPHRGASLFFGRNEKGGLRCVYHGWKFDTAGRCLDMPSEPPESDFKNRIRAKAYPVVERGGIVWAYLGKRETPPPLPLFDTNPEHDDEGEFTVEATLRECNWLQSLEGDIDTAHFGFLHHGLAQEEDTEPGTFMRYAIRDRAPRYACVNTTFGAMYGAYRTAEPGYLYWRIAQFLFPFYAQVPVGVLGDYQATRAWVPLDDNNTMFYSMHRKPKGGEPRDRLTIEGDLLAGKRPVEEKLPNGPGWLDRFRLVANARNDFLLDREKQRTSSYTGIPGVFTQDQAITESMGVQFDRSQEHLGSSDVMVIRVRRRLLEVIRALQNNGTTPPGVDTPEVYQVRSGGVILKENEDWLAAAEKYANPAARVIVKGAQ